jgi:hypothetical protein
LLRLLLCLFLLLLITAAMASTEPLSAVASSTPPAVLQASTANTHIGSKRSAENSDDTNTRENKRSNVWQYFKKVAPKVEKAVCNICLERKRQTKPDAEGTKLCTSGGTSNLWKHLRLHHKPQWEAYEQLRKPPQDKEYSFARKAMNLPPLNAETVLDLCVEFVVGKNIAFNVTADPAFVRMFHVLAPFLKAG